MKTVLLSSAAPRQYSSPQPSVNTTSWTTVVHAEVLSYLTIIILNNEF